MGFGVSRGHKSSAICRFRRETRAKIAVCSVAKLHVVLRWMKCSIMGFYVSGSSADVGKKTMKLSSDASHNKNRQRIQLSLGAIDTRKKGKDNKSVWKKRITTAFSNCSSFFLGILMHKSIRLLARQHININKLLMSTVVNAFIWFETELVHNRLHTAFKKPRRPLQKSANKN